LDGASKVERGGSHEKQSFLMAGLLVLTSMAATQVARAQDTMVVDIPFAFGGWNATLPAGEYRVQKLDWKFSGAFDSLLGRESVGLGDHPRGGGKGAAIRIEAGL